MKNNIGFFTHYTDAYENGKFLLLRAYYGGEKGWAMEAKFWALNCLIGRADNAKLDLSSKIKRAEVVKALDMSLAELDDFLQLLTSKEEGICLLHTESGVYWTEQTQEDLARAMTAREEAKERRNRRVGLPSGDESKTSGDDKGKSADEMHGGGGEEEGNWTGREFKREEEGSPTPLVDKSPEYEEALFRFTLARLAKRKKRPGDPEGMARKIMHEEDVERDFRKSIGQGEVSSPTTFIAPDPKPCPLCKGKIKADRFGEGRCLKCGTWYKYDHDFKEWFEVLMPGEDYPRTVFDAWAKLGDAVIQPQDFDTFVKKVWGRISPGLQGLHPINILLALQNLGKIATAPPGRYSWDRKIGIEQWVKDYLPRFLPDAFSEEEFFVHENVSV